MIFFRPDRKELVQNARPRVSVVTGRGKTEGSVGWGAAIDDVVRLEL